MTLPNGEVPDDADGFTHGNGSLAVTQWPKRRIPAGGMPEWLYVRQGAGLRAAAAGPPRRRGGAGERRL